jgi:DNA adenine methylase
VIEYVETDAFYYFDPPYKPVNTTNTAYFYNSKTFGDNEQKRLADFYKSLSSTNQKLLLSNSDDNLFDEIYSGFTIDRVKVKRMIHQDPAKRGEINELLIKNY